MTKDISGEAYQRKVEAYKKEYRKRVDHYKELLLASGYPPGTVPRSEREQFDYLFGARQAGEPWIMQDPEAMAELERLQRKMMG